MKTHPPDVVEVTVGAKDAAKNLLECGKFGWKKHKVALEVSVKLLDISITSNTFSVDIWMLPRSTVVVVWKAGKPIVQ
ncbi:hypothetical protein Ancab_001331, partial [Ancistrocladus abbreviatus]